MNKPEFRFSIVLFLVAVMGTMGCYDPAANKVDAGAGNAKKENQVQQRDSDVEFSLTGDNCDLKWTGSNAAGLSPHGYFMELTGRVVFEGEGGKLKRFELEIQMDGVQADARALTEKLKHKGFFQVDKFKTSRFVSTSISKNKREGDPSETTHVIEGNFTLRDVTKSISFPVTLHKKRTR